MERVIPQQVIVAGITMISAVLEGKNPPAKAESSHLSLVCPHTGNQGSGLFISRLTDVLLKIKLNFKYPTIILYI